MKFRRIVKEDIGGSFHDPWVIKKICERGRVTQDDIDSVKKWYDYEMRFPNPFMQNAHVMKDLCEDIFNMWEHRGELNERQTQEVEKHILEGKRTYIAGLQEYLKALVSIASIMVADNADLRNGYDESTSRGKIMNKLKKLNITKERFEKSKYFTKKYGKLEYVSESGNMYKTNKGNVLMFNESTKKFSKKFKESMDAEPAFVCPYCGGNNCEVSIGTDDLNFTYLDKLQGETFNVECWCNDCKKPYNVTVELNVKDV